VHDVIQGFLYISPTPPPSPPPTQHLNPSQLLSEPSKLPFQEWEEEIVGVPENVCVRLAKEVTFMKQL
jgi:hypothetical protein